MLATLLPNGDCPSCSGPRYGSAEGGEVVLRCFACGDQEPQRVSVMGRIAGEVRCYEGRG